MFYNILVVFESLNSMQKHIGKVDFMAIKLDMNKAYDRVKWSYLEAVMRKIGFNEQWISLMMVCVSSISYSILVNSEPKGLINHLEVFTKGTFFPYSSSSFASKVYMVWFLKLQFKGRFRAILFVDIA